MSSEKKPQPAFSPEALRELSEESSDQLSKWYHERFGEPDSRGRWKKRALTAEARVAQLEAALEPFARPPVYVFDAERRYVPAPQPDGWEGGGWFSTEDFRRARALLSDGGRG